MGKRTTGTKNSELPAAARKPGRPRTFDIEAAVQGAQTLFHAHGYDAVGIADLRDVFGASSTSIYAAFGSKLGLFEQVLRRYNAGPAGGFLPAALNASSTIDQSVRSVLHAAAAQYGSDPKCRGCMVLSGSITTEDREARGAMISMVKATEDVLVVRLLELGADEPEALARAVVGAMQGLSASARIGKSVAELKDIAERFLIGLTKH